MKKCVPISGSLIKLIKLTDSFTLGHFRRNPLLIVTSFLGRRRISVLKPVIFITNLT